MTNFAIICLSVAVGFVALGGIFSVSLCRAAAKPVPRPVPAVTAKGRPLEHCAFCGRLVAVRKARGPLRDGFCPFCSTPGVYLTRKGLPNLRYHNCRRGLTGAQAVSATWPPQKSGNAV